MVLVTVNFKKTVTPLLTYVHWTEELTRRGVWLALYLKKKKKKKRFRVLTGNLPVTRNEINHPLREKSRTMHARNNRTSSLSYLTGSNSTLMRLDLGEL